MRSVCTIEGCDEPVVGRGWCSKHYNRWSRWGDPNFTTFKRTAGTPAERWWLMVEKHDDGCWLWTGSKDRHGYGQFDVTADGVHKNHRAHRFGYQMIVRQIDADETLDHLCRVHDCVRPDHLDPVSHLVNVRRGQSGAHHRDKTHCVNGHEFTPENTHIDRRGWRTCVACQTTRNRRRAAPLSLT